MVADLVEIQPIPREVASEEMSNPGRSVPDLPGCPCPMVESVRGVTKSEDRSLQVLADMIEAAKSFRNQ